MRRAIVLPVGRAVGFVRAAFGSRNYGAVWRQERMALLLVGVGLEDLGDGTARLTLEAVAAPESRELRKWPETAHGRLAGVKIGRNPYGVADWSAVAGAEEVPG